MGKKRKLTLLEKRMKKIGDSTLSTNMANCSDEWQIKMETFTQRSQFILDNQEWTDCSFRLGMPDQQKIIQAHKVILAMSSPVFAKMMYGVLPERTFPVPIEDIDPNDFSLFLQYVYTGNVVLDSFEEAHGVWLAAQKYMVPGLVKLCIDKIWDCLNPKTACRVYEFAKFIGDKELEEQCIKIISLDTVAVLKDSSFEMIKTTTLETVLDMDDLSVPSELELFNALQRWAHSECERKAAEGATVTLRSVVSTTLPKVRFLTLEQKEVAEETSRSELLTSDENFAILINIISPKAKHKPMPPYFSTNRTPRNGNGNELSQNTDIYSWIRNVQTSKENKGIFSFTTISFEVAKRIKILGVQMHSSSQEQSYQSRASYHYSQPESTFNPVCIEVQSACGKPLSTTYFHRSNRTFPAIVEIDGVDYLERNKFYKLKITSFYGRSLSTSYPGSNQSMSGTSVTTGTQEPLSKTVIYHDLENLPIKSILFT